MIKWLNRGSGILGVWLIASPFILGYWRVTSALWSQLVAGVLLGLISLWQIVGIEEDSSQNIN